MNATPTFLDMITRRKEILNVLQEEQSELETEDLEHNVRVIDNSSL